MPTRKDIVYNMYNIYEYVKQLNVESGDTRRMNCPMCNSYKTFSVTNNMGSLLWNCYKASCVIRGSTRVRLSVDEIRDIQNKKSSQVVSNFELPEYVVPHHTRNEMNDWCNKWGLD